MSAVTVTAQDVRPLIPSQIMKHLAGEALSVGDLVYLDSSTTWKKTDSDAAATSEGIIGVVVAGNQQATTIASGEMASVCVFGRVTGFSSLTPAAKHYVSATAGKVDTAAGTVTRFVGYAEDATTLFIEPVVLATS